MRCPDCGEERTWNTIQAWLEDATLVPKGSGGA
jgi:hypothetical protein